MSLSKHVGSLPGSRRTSGHQVSTIEKAVAGFLQRCYKEVNVALWTKEGGYLGHWEWSTMMHFPLTSSANGRNFMEVVV